MIKRNIGFLLLLCPYLGGAQVANRGIIFVKSLSWEQVKIKAKAENKYLFVDCYATWCAPCKKMDVEVFQNDSLGLYMNDHFIAIRVQMDTSKSDAESVVSQYATARYIRQHFKVVNLPTFLFFAPDGKIVHRYEGFMSSADFSKLAKNATDPRKQYFTLLEAYQNGERDYETMSYLARMAKYLKNDQLADSIAEDYLDNYLFRLNPPELYTRKVIEFITLFSELMNSKTASFQLFYNKRETIDSIMDENGYADAYVDGVIYKEHISQPVDLAVQQHGIPDWEKMMWSISKKYDSVYADRIVTVAKVSFYRQQKDWTNYTKYLVRRIECYGVGPIHPAIMADFYLNNKAFEVFLHSNDQQELETALKWIDKATKGPLSLNASMIDTKANILYKLGRKDEAIALEEKAVQQAPRSKDFSTCIEKMKAGLPTWQ